MKQTGVRAGIVWTALGSVASNVVRIASVAVLARQLTPGEFGVVAASLTVLMVLSTIRDFGVSLALVQHKQPTQAHIGTAFTITLALALVIAGFMYFGSSWIAGAFKRPQTEPFVRALALLVLLRAAGQVSQQLCQRAMNFRFNQLVEISSYLAGAVVAIASAFAGAGAWSLIYGYVVEEAISTFLYVARFRPGWPRCDRGAAAELVTFGAGQTVAGLCNVIATQGDYVVIARYLGTTPLGYYTRAYELVQYPAKLFSSVVGTVLFPAFSRLQDDRTALAEAYTRVLFVNAALLLPASVLLIVVAPEALRLLLGNGWDGAVLPFQIMLAGMLFRTSYKVGGIILLAKGATGRAAVIQAVYAVSIVVGAVVAIRWGIVGVAVSTTVAIVVQFMILTAVASQLTALSVNRVMAAHLPGVVTTLAAATVGIPAVLLAREVGATDALVLAVAIASGLLACGAVAVMSVRRDSALWSWAWSELRHRRSKRKNRAR